MRLLITSDQHYHRTPDGSVWTPNQFAYSYWRRYLDTFDQVLVAARVTDVPAPLPDVPRANGHAVQFIALPSFLGPVKFARRLPRIMETLRDAAASADALILRLPSGIGIAAGVVIGRPYGVEIVADPHDAFARRAAAHALRPVARAMLTRFQRLLCRRASAAAYVTDRALQERYPATRAAFALSDVELPSSAFVDKPRDGVRDPHAPVLVSIGTMAALYKGHDNLVRVLAVLRRRGIQARLRLAGEGRYTDDIRNLAAALGVAEHVEFLGNVAGSAAARPVLDSGDVFVLASRAEGLCRALLEAMARGLPCVATAVGGTPEVLPPEVLARSDDPEAFAGAVEWLLASNERVRHASASNIRRARDFHEDRLTETRRAFLREVARAAASKASSRQGEIREPRYD